MKALVVITLFCLTSIAHASKPAQAGFIYQGKTYVVYEDGVKVGPTFEEKFPEVGNTKTHGRIPAQTRTAQVLPADVASTIRYFDDLANGVRCYQAPYAGQSLSCVKL